MSEKDEKTNKSQIEVSVKNDEELEKVRKALEAEKKARVEELEKIKKETEEMQEKLTVAEEERDDYKSKFDTMAVAEFEKRRNVLLEKAKSVIDSERYKVIEDGLNSPEKLSAVEIIVEQLQKSREAFAKESEAKLKAKDEEATKKLDDQKKELEAKFATEKSELRPTGTAPLNPIPALTGEGGKIGYESYGAMIRDLRNRERNGDVEAKHILDEFFKKWVFQIQRDSTARIVKVGEKADDPALKDIVNEELRRQATKNPPK